MRKLSIFLLMACLACAPLLGAAKGKAARENRTPAGEAARGVLQLPARDVFAGLTDEERTAILDNVLQSGAMQTALNNSRYRVIGVAATAVKDAGVAKRYAYTVVYDYTHSRIHQIINDITNGAPGTILQMNLLTDPLPPTPEEYAEARELVLALDRVKELMRQPNMVVEDSFPVDRPAPCDVHRCAEMQVNEILPGVRMHFKLFVTVDLNDRRIVEVREPRNPISMER